MWPDKDWTAAIRDHGGSLERARALFPDAPQPVLDLSTGINPHAYPFSLPAATAWTRLPESGRLETLTRLAAEAYGAPSARNVVAAPGTQILLPLVMGLVAPGKARIFGPTYAEHARAAALVGHRVEEVSEFEALFGADLAVIVNPNNPDGRIATKADLLRLVKDLRGRGGLLVVDEAFMDVGPGAESMCGEAEEGAVVVLRSFGKFFGLAGVRLGFAVASRELATRLESLMGPWAVSGPALEIGIEALGDAAWRETMRMQLADRGARLDEMLGDAGFQVGGGTDLYRYLEFDAAPRFFDHCGRRGILLRAFDRRPHALRIGLPGGEDEWARLGTALREWKEVTR
ncbi:MAG: threonine-phosphate decarboxylase CobD [Aliihoeflea sp.]